MIADAALSDIALSDDMLVDHHAERAMICIAMHGRTEEFLSLPPTVFDHWISDSIAKVMRSILTKGSPLDPVILSRALLAAEGPGSRGQAVTKALVNATTMGITGEAAPYYAERLVNLYVARRFRQNMEGFVRKVTYATVQDEPEIAARAYVEAREAIDDAESARNYGDTPEVLSIKDVMELPTTNQDWLVPELLESTDRLILTGLEGTGKSMLLAQFACTIGAGLHPFTGDPLDQSRTYTALVVDCENSLRQIQRRYRTITAQVDALRAYHHLPPADWTTCVRVITRPEGVAITDAREHAWLDHRLDTVQPDLVVIGPLYKMSKLDYRDEQAAKEVCDVLDGLRVRHQFALITEAHTGHAQDGAGKRSTRPLGSSLFLRWPEFGLGLAPAEGYENEEHPSMVNVARWRGSREERNWPFQLMHGDILPWVPSDYYRASFPRDT